jgi:hypothetical protein
MRSGPEKQEIGVPRSVFFAKHVALIEYEMDGTCSTHGNEKSIQHFICKKKQWRGVRYERIKCILIFTRSLRGCRLGLTAFRYGRTKDGGVLEKLSDYQLLRKDSTYETSCAFKAQWQLYVPPAQALKICILVTQCVCEFRMVLTINSDCFPKQH